MRFQNVVSEVGSNFDPKSDDIIVLIRVHDVLQHKARPGQKQEVNKGSVLYFRVY